MVSVIGFYVFQQAQKLPVLSWAESVKAYIPPLADCRRSFAYFFWNGLKEIVLLISNFKS